MGSLIRVEPSIIPFPPTYISGKTSYSITIINDSGQTLHYHWKNFATPQEDQEALNKVDIYDSEQRNKYSRVLDFSSRIFQPHFYTGEIWPHHREIVTIDFCPEVADAYTETAYLEDDFSQSRLPVTFKGIGLPPDSHFDYDSINIGHVYLDSVCEYDTYLINDGKVVIHFSLQERTVDRLKFEFTPSSGTIPIHEKQKIHVKFYATAVRQFSETFYFLVRGSVRFFPSICFTGKVLGPDAHISNRHLSFGDVSYGFLYKKTFDIENNSEIPFNYQLQLLQDTSYSPREFHIYPLEGNIPKYGKQQIVVEFVPITLQQYDVRLNLNILNVGDNIDTIYLTANCLSPILRVKKTNVNFDHIFIGHKYTKPLQLVNESTMAGKYEFILPDGTGSQGELSVSKIYGVINPSQTQDIDINFTPTVLGPIKILGYIRIFGSNDPPIPFTITGSSTGPNLIFQPERLYFGSIQVLSHIPQKLTISNDSLIDAKFTAEIQASNTCFSVEPTSGIIAGGDKLVLTVYADLDDTVAFSAKLALNVENLSPILIDIVATGIGTPIRASIDLSEINYDYILTVQPAIKTFTIKNYGRRQQEIRWTIGKAKVDKVDPSTFSFKVVPEQVVINTNQQVEFQMIAQGSAPCSFNVNVQCHGTVGRQRVDLFQPLIKGIIIKPLLQFSKQMISFVHTHDSAKEESLPKTKANPGPSAMLLPLYSETLTAKNLVKLPLTVDIDVSEPFSVSPNSFVLDPGDTIELTVSFNSGYKEDFTSETIIKK